MKIGLIGFGFMGKAFVHSLSSINQFYKNYIPNIEISGVVTSSNISSKKIDLKRYNIKKAYSDINELLSNDEIDSIYIASPNTFHFEQLISSIKFNKNVLCDKPITINSKQSKKVLNYQKSNKIYQMMFEYRNFPAIREIKSLIEKKKIGDLIGFKASYLHGSYLDTNRPISWRLKKGGGALSDLAPHVIDLCNFLIDDIEMIKGFKRNIISKRPKNNKSKIYQKVDVDDYAVSVCKTKKGVTGILDVSRLSMGSTDDLSITLNGTKGSLKWNLEELNFYHHLDEEGSKKIFAKNNFFNQTDFPPEKVSNGWLRAHAHSVYQFVSRVNKIKIPKKELSYIPSFEDGHKVQASIDAFTNINKFFK